MAGDPHFDLLGQKGDPLEREILSNYELLSEVLPPYAGIWADYVHANRLEGNPGRVVEAWSAFAGSHYTAIIRVYHALQAYLRLKNDIERIEGGDESAMILLDVHASAAAFWEHIGSAIDNLSMCWLDAPGMDMKFEKDQRVEVRVKNLIAPEESWLDWAFDRRSQFIHSRIVPKQLNEYKELVFNFRYFDRKTGSWPAESTEEKVAKEYYTNQWRIFQHEIAASWNTLYSRMRGRIAISTAVKPLESYNIDWTRIKPGDVKFTDGHVPPSTTTFIPPSG